MNYIKIATKIFKNPPQKDKKLPKKYKKYFKGDFLISRDKNRWEIFVIF